MRKSKGDVGLRIPEQRVVSLSDVNMDPFNPRVMSDEQMHALKASLVKHGMVLNLVIQKKGMVLIGGHQRVAAMRAICADKGWAEPSNLPAVILDVSDAEARQLNVALNKIDGEFDAFKLGELFSPIFPEMTAEDILATGFASEEISEVMRLALPPDEQAVMIDNEVGDLVGFSKSVTLSIEFETVEERDRAKEILKKAGASEKRKAGLVVLDAMRAYAATSKRPKGKRRAA